MTEFNADGSFTTGAPGEPRVTVITPTIQGRAALLERAKASVAAQTVPVNHRVIWDAHGNGPSHVRNLGTEAALTEWVAFLDDDDVLYPFHVEHLLKKADESGADIVYPWLHINKSDQGIANQPENPLLIDTPEGPRSPEGVEVTPDIMGNLDTRNFIPVTLLIRRAALLAVGGFPELNSERWPHDCCEDWGCWKALRDNGFIFAHLNERTWEWHWNGRNTSGKAENARALGDL